MLKIIDGLLHYVEHHSCVIHTNVKNIDYGIFKA